MGCSSESFIPLPLSFNQVKFYHPPVEVLPDKANTILGGGVTAPAGIPISLLELLMIAW
jgi:hypothetical protein